jgi:Glutaminase
MAKGGVAMTQARVEREFLTIAAIRRGEGERTTEVLFNEKQRIFTFRSAATRAAEASAVRLGEAFEKGVPVTARLDERRGFIQRVSVARGRELEEFQRRRTYVDEPEKIHRIDLSEIDPTTFNIVDHYLKIPVFRLCSRVIPNYATAKAIFDFCAQQSCHLPGPYAVPNCIPFQYVIDGCYARAHEMRRIITTQYRYCCEKVFSFAVDGFDRLAVRADKWGGCCVTWWYHVAPLVRVRISIKKLGLSAELAMVIDPGIFDKPVLLTSWLAAQQNAGCHPNARVSMYSIQPGSAYTPAWGSTSSFTTDPSYTATSATLIAYKNLVTCP